MWSASLGDLVRSLLLSFGLVVLALATPQAGRVSQVPQPPPPQTAGTTPAGDAERGKLLFVKDGCYQCHNYEGQGGVAGARLAPNPIPFNGFIAYVRRPRRDMPPYTVKVISDQDLADVYAFLRSRPRPPDVSSIPILAR